MQDNNQKSNRNLLLFFLLTFICSWSLWLPFVLWGFGVIQLSESIVSLMTPSVVLGAFGPMLAAVILIARKKGRHGVREFFRNAFSFRVKPKYYVLAFLLPVLITAVAHYLVNFTGIDILPANLFPEGLPVPVIALVIPYFIFILVAGGGQEEFGWRGYAQEPMQQRFGILGGSILLGIAWGVWHLPLWFMPGEGHAYYSFFAFLLYTISTSVIIGWLYNASGKKFIIPWIIHASGNVAVPFFPVLHLEDLPQPGYWVWVGINFLVATCMTVWYMKKPDISSR
jgi:hypothetical protein